VTFRYEWRQLGAGVLSVYRVGADGRTVAVDHGNGAVSIWSGREDALRGIPEEIRPR